MICKSHVRASERGREGDESAAIVRFNKSKKENEKRKQYFESLFARKDVYFDQ